MSTYLDTPKIQALNRLTLCHAALRNLGVIVGDNVEVYFDEELGCLLIKPISSNTGAVDSALKLKRSKKKRAEGM